MSGKSASTAMSAPTVHSASRQPSAAISPAPSSGHSPSPRRLPFTATAVANALRRTNQLAMTVCPPRFWMLISAVRPTIKPAYRPTRLSMNPRPAIDTAMSNAPPPITSRPPYLSSARPTSGPASAAATVPTLNAPEMTVRDHPNSSVHWERNTLNIGAATAPLTVIVTSTAPATTHP